LIDINVSGTIKLSHRVIFRKSFVVDRSISDFEFFSFPSSDFLMEKSMWLIYPNSFVELTVDNEVFESTSTFSLKSDIIDSCSITIRDTSSCEVEDVFSSSGFDFNGDMVDIIVFRSIVKDSGSVPSNIETQTIKSDVISSTERKLESEGSLGLAVVWAKGDALECNKKEGKDYWLFHLEKDMIHKIKIKIWNTQTKIIIFFQFLSIFEVVSPHYALLMCFKRGSIILLILLFYWSCY